MPEEISKYGFIYSGAIVNEVVDDLNDFKSIIDRKNIKFPSQIGEEHPYNPQMTHGLYEKFGFLTGLIEKKVEHIWGNGFHVQSNNKNAKAIIENWLQDVGFITIGKRWTRQAFVNPTGYIELGGKITEGIKGIKVLDSRFIYKKRDEKGRVIKYIQLIKGMEKDRDLQKKPLQKNQDYIEIEPDNIAEFAVNQIGDCAYGLGYIYPNLDVINSYLGNRKNFRELVKRKANSPYWIKMGSLEHNVFPDASAVSSMGQKLTYLQNKTEWVTGPDIDIKVLDFGNVSDKFKFPLENDLDMLFYGFQNPKSESGSAISTGLGSNVATEHSTELDLHIKSIQEELEKIIEEKIFKRVLLSNGMEDHVEIVWGEANEQEKKAKIQLLMNLLNSPMLTNMQLRKQIEKDMAILLGYDEAIITQGQDERDEEEQQQQPAVPGSLNMFYKIKNIFNKKNNVRQEKIIIPNDINKDYSLIEWLGFNYRKFTGDILNKIDKDDFKNIAALNVAEMEVGYLTTTQLTQFKEVMKETFVKGLSIRTMASTLFSKDIIPNLYKIEDGEKILVIGKEYRSLIIARTETIRISAQGALDNYRKGGIERVRFLAATSDRTCPICESLNGQVYEINGIPQEADIPIHVNCRCTYSPVVLT